MSTPTLAQRVSAIDSALSGVLHAFGGALALAYYAEPRATIDIDVNVFVRVERVWDILRPLGELGLAVDDPSLVETVQRDGQARVMWDATPVDIFFAYDSFHDAAGAAIRIVPFGSGAIPILAPEHLIVCKVVFNRPRDWVDIDSMLEADADIDPAEVLRWVARITGDNDPRFNRIASTLTRR